MKSVNNLLFRCHALGSLMTNGTGEASGKMGKTAHSYLKKYYREWKYDRVDKFSSKEIEKGLILECEGIDEVGKKHGLILTKNDVRLSNEFLTGEPDAFTGETIYTTKHGFDIKNSWSLSTLPIGDEKLNPVYHWQSLGYIDLTGADKWTVSYVLLNAPVKLLESEKYKASLKYQEIDYHNNPKYIEDCKEIEKNLIYDFEKFTDENPNYDTSWSPLDWEFDIPMSERIVEFTIERDDEKIRQIHERVKEAREFIQKL